MCQHGCSGHISPPMTPLTPPPLHPPSSILDSSNTAYHPQLSNTPVRPHWSTAEVRLYIHVCLKKIRKQTAEPFHYSSLSLSQTAREVNRFFFFFFAVGDSLLKYKKVKLTTWQAELYWIPVITSGTMSARSLYYRWSCCMGRFDMGIQRTV